jgi:hypothetical protein
LSSPRGEDMSMSKSMFLSLLLNDLLEAVITVLHYQAEEQRGDLAGHKAPKPAT